MKLKYRYFYRWRKASKSLSPCTGHEVKMKNSYRIERSLYISISLISSIYIILILALSIQLTSASSMNHPTTNQPKSIVTTTKNGQHSNQFELDHNWIGTINDENKPNQYTNSAQINHNHSAELNKTKSNHQHTNDNNIDDNNQKIADKTQQTNQTNQQPLQNNVDTIDPLIMNEISKILFNLFQSNDLNQTSIHQWSLLNLFALPEAEEQAVQSSSGFIDSQNLIDGIRNDENSSNSTSATTNNMISSSSSSSSSSYPSRGTNSNDFNEIISTTSDRSDIINSNRENLPTNFYGQVITTKPRPYFGDAFYNFQTMYLPIHGVVCLILCTFGIFANVINIIVLTRPNMTTGVNMILSAIAFSDLIVNLSNIPFLLHQLGDHTDINFYSLPWAVYIIIHAHTSVTAHTISIWLTCVLATLRYYVVCRSQTSNRRGWSVSMVKRLILAIFVLVPTFCIPNYLTFSILEEPGYLNQIAYKVGFSKLANESGFIKAFHFWIYSFMNKLLPCALLTFFTTFLIKKLLSARDRRLRLATYGQPVKASVDIGVENNIGPVNLSLLNKQTNHHGIGASERRGSTFIYINASYEATRNKTDIEPDPVDLARIVTSSRESNDILVKRDHNTTSPNCAQNNVVKNEYTLDDTISSPSFPITTGQEFVSRVTSGQPNCLSSKDDSILSNNHKQLKQSISEVVNPSSVGKRDACQSSSIKTSLYASASCDVSPINRIKKKNTKFSKDDNNILMVSHNNIRTVSSRSASAGMEHPLFKRVDHHGKSHSLAINNFPDNVSSFYDKASENYDIDGGKFIYQNRNIGNSPASHIARLTPGQRQLIQNETTTKLLIAIIIVFLICEFPAGILAALCAVLGEEFIENVYQPIGMLTDLLALINSAVNFILYCLMSNQFRDTFYRVVLRCPATPAIVN